MDIAKAARQAVDGKKGEDIRLLDVRGTSTLTDFFLVVTGNSPPHLKAMSDEVSHCLKKLGVRPYGTAGAPESGWMALDYVDVIIHMFLRDTRIYYAIEDLWQAAPRVD
jgi:ribosome-associated protein